MAHICARCGRRFARAENLRKHMSKKKPCLPIVSNQSSQTPSWDPIPDSIPKYTGLDCPFCTKTLSNSSNRDRHIRHYCEHAKQVFFEEAIQLQVDKYIGEVHAFLETLDPNMTIGELLDGQNLITNRENGK